MGNEVYPYRGSDAATRKAADQVLRSVTPMVRQQIETMNRLDLGEEALDEIHSNVMVLLWKHSLPQYDATRKSKPSTFLYRCSFRFIISEFRRIGDQARSKKTMVQLSPERVSQHQDASQFLDSRVEKLADDVIRHPTEYMSTTYARVLMARVENPDMPVKDLATLLGYTHSRSLSTVLTRIREIIAGLEIETYATPSAESSEGSVATDIVSVLDAPTSRSEPG